MNRKLDALIGKYFQPGNGYQQEFLNDISWDCDGFEGEPSYWNRSEREWVLVPKYSTDISAAWELFEWLSDNYEHHIRLSLSVLLPRRWVIEYGPSYEELELAEHETPATCICLAFLRAKGVPQSEIDEAAGSK